MSNFVNVLYQYNYDRNLQSSATHYLAIEKLPSNLNEKKRLYVDDCQEDRPDLILFKKWLG